MATNIIRKLRSWFLDSPVGSSGDRFNTGNKPTKATFKALLDSVLFPSQVEDTAKTTAAGHVKVAQDAYAQNRNSYSGGTAVYDPTNEDNFDIANLNDAHTIVVVPHQLPNMEVSDGSEAKTTDTPVTDAGITITPIVKTTFLGTRRNFRFGLNLGGSMRIVSKKLQLENDSDSPADNTYYGKKSGARGWFPYTTGTILPVYTWLGGTLMVLTSDGTGLSWRVLTIPTGSGNALPPDEQTIYSYLGKLAVKLLPVASQNAIKAAALSYADNGIYVKIDGDSIKANAQGFLYTDIPDAMGLEKLNGYLKAKLMFEHQSDEGYVENPSKAPVIQKGVNGLFVSIDSNTLGFDKNKRLYAKSRVIPTTVVTIADDFIGGVVDETKWQTSGVAAAESEPDGAVTVAVNSEQAASYIKSILTMNVDQKPVFEAYVKGNMSVDIVSEVFPEVLIGLMGDGSTEVKGDFIGFLLNDDYSWTAMLKINAVVISSLILPEITMDLLYHKFGVVVNDDGSAEFYVDDVLVYSLAAGSVVFAGNQYGIIDVAYNGADAEIITDFMNVTRDRTVPEIPT